MAWKDFALLGWQVQEGVLRPLYRTTMAQNDLGNGRMICLIGVAPANPAEFVIFRIGQVDARLEDGVTLVASARRF